MQRFQQSTKPAAAPSKQALGDAHLPGRLRELLGARVEREVYLSTADAARYIDSPSRQALIKWCRRHGVPLRRPAGGRQLVVRKSDLDWALRERV